MDSAFRLCYGTRFICSIHRESVQHFIIKVTMLLDHEVCFSVQSENNNSRVFSQCSNWNWGGGWDDSNILYRCDMKLQQMLEDKRSQTKWIWNRGEGRSYRG